MGRFIAYHPVSKTATTSACRSLTRPQGVYTNSQEDNTFSSSAGDVNKFITIIVTDDEKVQTSIDEDK